MNNRERVIASLRHEQPDATPYQVDLTRRARETLDAHVRATGIKAPVLDNALFGFETSPDSSWREVAPDTWEDEFGVRWDRSVDKDIGVVCNRTVTPTNFDAYAFPDPAAPERWRPFAEFLPEHPDRFRIASMGFSLFERAWTLYGMENLLLDMVAEPDFVHALLDRILDHNLAIIDRACAFDIDAMRFGDDWGSQTGLIMGIDLWRTFIGPRVRAMYERVRAHGKFVFIHSCGKVDELFPDLIDMGLDCFNPFQPEVMDVRAMKQRYGDRLSFFGGISTQQTLPYGTVEQTREEVRGLLRDIGRGGGYIAAPAHALPGDARPENIVAMVEVLNQQA